MSSQGTQSTKETTIELDPNTQIELSGQALFVDGEHIVDVKSFQLCGIPSDIKWSGIKETHVGVGTATSVHIDFEKMTVKILKHDL